MNHLSFAPIALLLLAAAIPAQAENWRSFGIVLSSRPAGSPPGTAYTLEAELGAPTGFGSGAQWDNTPWNAAITPVSLAATWSLLTTKEYQFEFRGAGACTAGYANSVSLGQRLILDLSATFSQPSVVSLLATNPGFEAMCGNFLLGGWPPPIFYYSNFGNQLPWSDSAQGQDNGNSVSCNMAMDYSPSIGVLQYTATADVSSYQEYAPPPPFQGFGVYYSRSTVEFTVSQAMTVDIGVSSQGPVRGQTQFFPLLPFTQPNGFYGRTHWWYDPPMAVGYDFEMTGTSLFTDIETLPVGIDSDGQFEVVVGGVSLGWFPEGSRVDFRQLLGGNGVTAFRIVGIDPKDSTDATVFPVQLAFDTPEAGFTMTALPWRKVGASCGDAVACPQCPQLTLAPVGDALEGNLNFALGIDHGPGGGAAAVFLALGPVSTMPVPLFCGEVVVPLSGPVYAAGITSLTGVGACGGGGSVPVPLPSQTSLFGLIVTAQAVTLCPAGGLGLTHGVEFAIGN